MIVGRAEASEHHRGKKDPVKPAIPSMEKSVAGPTKEQITKSPNADDHEWEIGHHIIKMRQVENGPLVGEIVVPQGLRERRYGEQ